MMPPSGCRQAQAALQWMLSEGREPRSEDLAHLSACPECRAVTHRIQTLLGTLPEPAPVLEETPTMDLHAELKRQSTRHLLVQVLGVMSLVSAFAAFWAWVLKDPATGWSWGVSVGLVALFALPVLLLLMLARLPRKYRLYKRLREGRMLSGVCLGLAERTGTPVWAWRVGWVALSILSGNAALLYAVMASVMPVHPEDRAGLLRFRVARWFRALKQGPAKTA